MGVKIAATAMALLLLTFCVEAQDCGGPIHTFKDKCHDFSGGRDRGHIAKGEGFNGKTIVPSNYFTRACTAACSAANFSDGSCKDDGICYCTCYDGGHPSTD